MKQDFEKAPQSPIDDSRGYPSAQQLPKTSVDYLGLLALAKEVARCHANLFVSPYSVEVFPRQGFSNCLFLLRDEASNEFIIRIREEKAESLKDRSVYPGDVLSGYIIAKHVSQILQVNEIQSVPKVHALGQIEGYAYSIEERLEGNGAENFRPRYDTWRDVGFFQSKLHAIPTRGYGGWWSGTTPRCVPGTLEGIEPAQYATRVSSQVLAALANAEFPASTLARAEAILAALTRLPLRTVLCHGDMRLSNVLRNLSGQTGRNSLKVVDWDSAVPNCSEYDLAFTLPLKKSAHPEAPGTCVENLTEFISLLRGHQSIISEDLVHAYWLLKVSCMLDHWRLKPSTATADDIPAAKILISHICASRGLYPAIGGLTHFGGTPG